MAKFMVLEGGWRGQIGEFVREEIEKAVEVVVTRHDDGSESGIAQEVEKVARIVLRMAGGRIVEFAPEIVEPHAEPEGEPEAEPKAAE